MSRNVEILTDYNEALKKAEELDRSAKRSVSGVWSIAEYTPDLIKYYEETLRRSIHTERFIDRSHIKQPEILDHLERSWESLRVKHTYDLYFPKFIGFEAMLVDDKEGALFLYPGSGFHCFFNQSKSDDFTNFLRGIFSGVGHSLYFPATIFPETFDKTQVNDWLSKNL